MNLTRISKIFVGFTSQTLIDFPNHISAILFTYGCSFRCPYCYNLSCLYYDKREFIDMEYFLDYLDRSINNGFLDGLVITGGEPTLQTNNLIKFISFLKDRYEDKLKIKLDTNGSFPDKLQMLFDYVDYIAMDVKVPRLDMYRKITNLNSIEFRIKESILELINTFGKNKEYEFRVTLYPEFFTNIEQDKKDLAILLRNAKRVYLQQFINKYEMVDKNANKIIPLINSDILEMKEYLENFIEEVKIRNMI